MSVFAFMGSSLLRQDDSYTFDVINRTLESVVPKLVKVIIFLVHYMYMYMYMHVVQGVCQNTCSSERILHSYYIS